MFCSTVGSRRGKVKAGWQNLPPPDPVPEVEKSVLVLDTPAGEFSLAVLVRFSGFAPTILAVAVLCQMYQRVMEKAGATVVPGLAS